MQHFEYMYLVSMAHKVREWEKEAEEGGGTFHASPMFVPLEDRLLAQARIKNIAGVEVFAVIIRQDPNDLDDKKVTEAAKSLFPKGYDRLKTITKGGYKDHLFVSSFVPSDVTKEKATSG
jgi:hypothetical protein